MITRILTLILAFAFTLQAQANYAPISIKGQQDATAEVLTNLQAPNKLATKTGNRTWVMESGNKNILANPSFEHSTFSTGWNVLNINCPASVNTSIVIDGKQSLVKTCNGTGDAPDVYQDSTLYQAQFADGIQGIASIRVKTDAEGIYVCPRKAGATLSDLCVAVASDNKWGLYQIPFVLGGTSNGIIVTSNLATISNKTIYIDDAFVGANDIAGTATLDTDWSSCGHTTSDFTGFGTVTSIETQCKRDGSDLLMKGKFTAGTVTGVEARLALKFSGVSLVSANTSKIPTIQLAGDQVRAAQSSTYFRDSTLIEPSVSYITFGRQSSTQNAITKALGTDMSASTSHSFFARVPISGWSSNSDYYSSQCGANCVDTFSAKVSSADVVSDENVNWINGDCTNATTGKATCAFNTGVFTVTPNCWFTNTATNEGLIESISATSITVNTYNNGSLANGGFHLACQKQGADFVATRVIQGSFLNVPVAPGIQKPKICHYAFGGTSATLAAPTECTTGTCVEVYDSCLAGTPPSFSSTGIYINLTFSDGTFANSTYVKCDCIAYDTTTGSYRECNPYFDTGDSSWSSTSSGGYVMNILTRDASNVQNTYVQVECKGQAP